jgi:hypothetical protein
VKSAPFVILNLGIVILNSFQDLSRQSAKPSGVLKQVQDDDSFLHDCAIRNGI